jgi:alpha-methylacyl-CoA racemase
MLDGITVVDLSQVGPASRCTAVLADLGAKVIKVVPPASAGRIDPPSYAYGGGRGTERVEIDLRGERDAYLSLCDGADVVVESFRPGVADRLEVGYGVLKKRNPRLVYCATTGYGQDGPYASWAGHDLNYLAVGGYLATQGARADGGPALPGATIADSAGGGFQAAIRILAALVRRGATGEGAFIDVSTTDGVLSLMSLQIDEFLATGVEAGPGATLLTGKYACYDVYRARDGGFVAVAAIEQKFFGNLCRALGRDELAEFQYDDARQDDLRAALREAFATRDRDHWVADLAPMDTCVSPVLSIAEVTRDAHLQARGAFAGGRLGPVMA